MKLYISDLDKTLLNDNAELSVKAKDELNQMISKGLPFTIATARSWVSASTILEGLDLRLPVICSNGSILADYNSGDYLDIITIRDEIREGVLDIILGYNTHPFISTVKDGKHKLFHGEMNNAGLEWYMRDLLAAKDPRREFISDFKAELRSDLLSFTVIDREEIVEKICLDIEKKYPSSLEYHYYENPYDKGWFWLSIHDIASNKGVMVERLAERLDIALSDVTVFGDNVNDIPMFTIDTRAVAIGNAVQPLKDVSNFIAGTNMEDGVVGFIRRDLSSGGS